MDNVLAVRGLTRTFKQGDYEVHAVNNVDLEIQKGDFVGIIGASGSGKTTLLNMLGCIDRPTAGEVTVNGQSINGASDARLSEIRRCEIGYIHQDFQLLPILNAAENIIMPLLLDGQKPDREEVKELAESLGIAERLTHLPAELSGGQQQRVAIARTLITHPSIILADEPTGNLDKATAEDIMDLLVSLNRQGHTILLVTHNEDFAKRCTRLIRMTDGALEEIA